MRSDRGCHHGFVLGLSDGNTLTGNTAIDNDQWGFFVDAVPANMFQGNVCSGNGRGVAS